MASNKLGLAIVLLLMATMSWGGMFPVAKHVLASMDPYYMTFIRYAVVAFIFVLMLIGFEGLKALKLDGQFLKLLFLGFLGFAGFNLLAFTALEHSRPEHGAVIMALQPMLALLLTWLLKGQKPKLFTLITLITAFLGVFLVITEGHISHAFSKGTALWDSLFLLGALCWVGYTMGAQWFSHWSALRYTTITSVLGSLSVGAVTLVLTLDGTLQMPTLATMIDLHWSLFYLIVFGGVLAVLSWNIGIKLIGAVNGVLFINFVPITAFIIGVFYGHHFSLAELIGASLVIGALIANNQYVRRTAVVTNH